MKRLLFLLISFLPACGYNLRGNTRPFFTDHQIHTIYVQPIKNNSYKAGIEITVYNALRKRIAEGGYVRIVDQPDLADASMVCSVQDASYAPAGITTAEQVQPLNAGKSDVQVASSYNVNLQVKFALYQNHPSHSLWADELIRSKSFQATTYVGALGTTSALINESDFERTLSDLSVSIVTDAEESINSIF